MWDRHWDQIRPQLFLVEWEETNIRPRLGVDLALWRRFIDDIIFIWKHSKEDLELFLRNINQIQLTLRFTSNITEETEFLDLKIKELGNRYICKTFFKSMSKNSFIQSSSCHLPNWLINVPFGLFRRIRRKCTQDQDFETEAIKMKNQFLDKKYPEKVVDAALERTRKLDRQTWFTNKEPVTEEKQDTEAINLIIVIRGYKKIIKTHWQHILSDKMIGHLLPVIPSLTFTNLGLKIAPSIKTPKPIMGENTILGTWMKLKGFFKCDKCMACKINPIPRKTTTISSTQNTHTWEIKECLTCNTSRVIYLIQCPCKRQYIGRTKRPMKTRLAEHIANIRKGYDKHCLAKHFRDVHNKDPSNLIKMHQNLHIHIIIINLAFSGNDKLFQLKF
ncbi:uncharacterized protein LOC122932203 [Bufo gargarizans]|uniref:uncharacterized protein LOC122932203 n=1 Tax=Bufo gargarizans TaxID=30331 RepID=UPI001CF44AE4|nr:uncharacterized protein LOC122932203 [Bufo gargarizans]